MENVELVDRIQRILSESKSEEDFRKRVSEVQPRVDVDRVLFKGSERREAHLLPHPGRSFFVQTG